MADVRIARTFTLESYDYLMGQVTRRQAVLLERTVDGGMLRKTLKRVGRAAESVGHLCGGKRL